MKEFITKTYECDYCTQAFPDKEECIKHEKECWFNPNLKGCMTCANKTPILLGQKIDRNCIGVRFRCKKGLIKECNENEIYSKNNCQYWQGIK